MIAAGISVHAQEEKYLSEGQWRGELLREDGNHIVFNFEVYKEAGKIALNLRNAGERLMVDDITVQDDSVFIRLPFFDSQFRAVFVNNAELKGVWIKHLAERNVVMPFVAVNTGRKAYRFKTENKRRAGNITGRWSTIFINPVNEKETQAVGVFKQRGEKVTGSFITPSGDYRYLEGVIDGDSLKISGFDGGYAIYFTAKINDGQTITGGKYFSGNGSVPRVWKARKDPSAQLPDNLSATHLKPGITPRLDFTFPDITGNPVSFSEQRFKDKVVVVQILGSWCPNCLDETVFLNEMYKKYQSEKIEILGLAYERSTDFNRSRQSVKNFMMRLKVEYPVLITPVAADDPQNAEKTLPQLDKILIFPTTVFIDRKGEIQKILTGFNGPGTGAEYERQKKIYIDIIDDLLSRE